MFDVTGSKLARPSRRRSVNLPYFLRSLFLRRVIAGPVDDSTSPPPISRVHFWSGIAFPRRLWPCSQWDYAPRGSKQLLAERASRAFFALASVLAHVTRSKCRTLHFGRMSAHLLDELRWVGMVDCDLPVLSVFKDLHPRVCWLVLLAAFCCSDQTDVHSASPASVSPCFLRCFRSKTPTPPLDGTGWTRSSPLTLGRSRSLRHALSDLRNHRSSRTPPLTSVAFPRSVCSQWRYTPREPSRAHGTAFAFLMGLVCNERSSRALPQAVPRFSPMGRSTQLNGFPRRGAPLPGLCTAPVRTNRSHTRSRLSTSFPSSLLRAETRRPLLET